MYTVRLVGHDQLREDDRQATVSGRVADVLLSGFIERRVDHELLPLGVVRGGGLQLLDVRAVSGLGHGERARQLKRRDRPQVALVVRAGPKLVDRSAPQTELHAELDQQREVPERERFECRHVCTRITLSSEFNGEPGRRQAFGGERFGPLQHALPILVRRNPDRRLELRPCDHAANLLAQLSVASVEQLLQRGGVELLSGGGDS